ncbi:hypothetical protein [Haliangium sp.]|uniref:hypothetical protein n=1 Tax=Haliangium sp. TaxID=2663208 RepID=UPI003D136BF9
MSNFQEAFEIGQQAFDDRKQARQEIYSVFEDMGRQLEQASQGKLHLRRARAADVSGLDQAAEGMRRLAINLLGGPQRWIAEDPSFSHELLVAYSGPDDQPRGAEVLCLYELHEAGYPVKLSYSKERVYCHDRASLEAGLQDLLKHPDSAGKLRRVMDDETGTE